MAEHLRSLGYATGGFSANLSYVTSGYGLARGFEVWHDFFSNPVDMAWRTQYGNKLLQGLPLLGYENIPGRRYAPEMNRDFLAWLSRRSDEPYFAFLNYLDVHGPYMPPAPFDRMFTTGQPPKTRLNNFLLDDDSPEYKLSDEDVQFELDSYDGAIAYLDAALGELFLGLAAHGSLDDTVVIVTSDHGESFGTHKLFGRRYFGHGHVLYRDVVHVPLTVRFPSKVTAGRQVTCPVTLQSVPATVMDLVGAGGSPFPGRTLVNHWVEHADNAACDDVVLVEDLSDDGGKPMKAVIGTSWQLIVNKKKGNEIFRFDQDPDQQHDLSDTLEGQEMKAVLGGRMRELMSPREWARFGRFAEFHR